MPREIGDRPRTADRRAVRAGAPTAPGASSGGARSCSTGRRSRRPPRADRPRLRRRPRAAAASWPSRSTGRRCQRWTAAGGRARRLASQAGSASATATRSSTPRSSSAPTGWCSTTASCISSARRSACSSRATSGCRWPSCRSARSGSASATTCASSRRARCSRSQGAELICVPTAWLTGFDQVKWDADGLAPQAEGGDPSGEPRPGLHRLRLTGGHARGLRVPRLVGPRRPDAASSLLGPLSGTGGRPRGRRGSTLTTPNAPSTATS